jgi:hypothetical protein
MSDDSKPSGTSAVPNHHLTRRDLALPAALLVAWPWQSDAARERTPAPSGKVDTMISSEDQRALEDLHNRYVHATDRHDLALLRSLYTADGIENHGGYNGSVDDFIPWLKQTQDYFEIATHTISNLLAAVDGDTAQSEARGTAYLKFKGSPPFNMIVVNRHFDQYRKVAGKWLFSRRSLCIDWVQQFPPITETLDLVKAVPAGKTTHDDPIYANVPHLIAALHSAAPPRK